MLVVSFELFTLKFTKVCDNNSVQTDKSPDNVCLKLEFIRINRKKRTMLPVKKDFTLNIVISHLENGLTINHVLNNNTLT